jgi:hypothetical protein
MVTNASEIGPTGTGFAEIVGGWSEAMKSVVPKHWALESVMGRRATSFVRDSHDSFLPQI